MQKKKKSWWKQERNRTCVLQLSLIWTDKLLRWRDAMVHFNSHFIFLCMLMNSLNTSSVDSFSDLSGLFFFSFFLWGFFFFFYHWAVDKKTRIVTNMQIMLHLITNDSCSDERLEDLFQFFAFLFQFIFSASCTFWFPGTCFLLSHECASWMWYIHFETSTFFIFFFCFFSFSFVFFGNKILLLWWTTCEWWRMFSVMCDEISWMPLCVRFRVMWTMRVCGICAMLLLFLSPILIMLFAPNFFDLTHIDFQVLKQKCVSVLYPSLIWL